MLKGIVGAAVIAAGVFAATPSNEYHPVASPFNIRNIKLPKTCVCDEKHRPVGCGAMIVACLKNKDSVKIKGK